MTLRRKIITATVVVCGLLLAGWLAAQYPFLAAMRECSRVKDDVFMPFAELQVDFTHNGFGVFILEFRDHSLLSDSNVGELLLLNEMPTKYELFLLIDTDAVTDESIDTLATLTTVDYFIVGDSVLSPDGFATLGERLPPQTSLGKPTKTGG